MQKVNLQSNIIALSFLILSFTFPVSGNAAYFELGTIPPPITVGDIVRIPVYVDTENAPVFIVDTQIVFPRDLLWAKSFTIAPGWLVVPGEEYNYIDNGRGVIQATAGFEEGIFGRSLIGTLELIALKDGIAQIDFLKDSSIFNSENENILKNANSINTTVEIFGPKNIETLPSQLFDIRVELAKNTITPREPLVAHVAFQSFGQTPTPVDIFFSIIDGKGKIFMSSEESLVVETEAIFIKQFENLNLPSGKYALHVSTRYNFDVKDYFHAPFLIYSPWYKWRIVGIAALALLALFFTCIFWLRKIKKWHKVTKL